MTGVEMALDGALTSLCGAFDSAAAGLVTAVGEWAGVDLKPVASHELSKPTHFYDRIGVLIAHNRFGNDLQPLSDDVRAALRFDRSNPEVPKGWLKHLHLLRNATVHHNTLARHIDVALGGSSTFNASWSVSIDREGVEPGSYLRDARNKVSGLTSRMLAVVDLICPNGVPTLSHFDRSVVAGNLRATQAVVSARHAGCGLIYDWIRTIGSMPIRATIRSTEQRVRSRSPRYRPPT